MKVINFGALWCPGCLIMNPIWNSIETQYNDIEFLYYDYDDDNELANFYNVGKVLPVAIFLKNNIEIYRFVGEIKKKIIIEKIEEIKKTH